jgi:hypothetical protein
MLVAHLGTPPIHEPLTKEKALPTRAYDLKDSDDPIKTQSKTDAVLILRNAERIEILDHIFT